MTTVTRFEFLDGLRGIAALGVIFFHFNGSLKEHSHFSQFLLSALDLGHLGVQIFFVLSGFVIAYSLRQEKLSCLFVLRFFVRRSIRLDPPYWVAALAIIVLSLLGQWLFNK